MADLLRLLLIGGMGNLMKEETDRIAWQLVTTLPPTFVLFGT